MSCSVPVDSIRKAQWRQQPDVQAGIDQVRLAAWPTHQNKDTIDRIDMRQAPGRVNWASFEGQSDILVVLHPDTRTRLHTQGWTDRNIMLAVESCVIDLDNERGQM